MDSKALAALFGASAWIFLAAGPAAAAPEQKTPPQHQVHRTAVLESVKREAKAEIKDTDHNRTAIANRQVIVSVGPQAMAGERIRDIAMAPTG